MDEIQAITEGHGIDGRRKKKKKKEKRRKEKENKKERKKKERKKKERKREKKKESEKAALLISQNTPPVVIEMLANVNLGADLKVLAQGGSVAIVGSRGEVRERERYEMR